MLIKNAFIVRFFKKDIAEVNYPTLFNCQDNAYVDMVFQQEDRVRLEEFLERRDSLPLIVRSFINLEKLAVMSHAVHLTHDRVCDVVQFRIPEQTTLHAEVMSLPIDVFRRLIRRLNN